MKYLFAAFASLFLLGACQKEINGEFENIVTDSTDTTPVTTSALIKAKIDGVAWMSDQRASAVLTPYDSGTRYYVYISGIKSDGSTIELAMEDFHTGTFYFVDTSYFNGGAYTKANGDFFSYSPDSVGVGTESITVTTIDTVNHTFSGTFRFTGYNDTSSATLSVTDGEFNNLPYTGNAGYPPITVHDTFHVKITDTLYSPYSLIVASVNSSMAIAASDSVGSKRVTLYMPETVAPGTYAFDSLTYKAVYVAGANTYQSRPTSGTLTVLESNVNTGRKRGTFSFTAYRNGSPADSTRFTEGYFSIKF